MKNKKKTSFSEKLNKAKPNSVIEVTPEDRARQWWGNEKEINNKKKESNEFLFLFLGLIFGTVGSYISAQIYDFSKLILFEKYGFQSYFLFNIFIWFVFGIILTIFILKIRGNNKSIGLLREDQERWSKTKQLHIGTIMSPEFMENFNEEVNNKIKNSILEEIKEGSFSTLGFLRKTNIPLSIINSKLNELIREQKIRKKGFAFWKKYRLNQ